MTKSTPRPPRHLSVATRKWWAQIVADYVLESHHLKILTLAAEAWDRGQTAREVLDREGLTFIDRFGQPKARPEVAIARDSATVYLRALRELDLDVEPPADATRPPQLRRYG
ncbi:MAG: P27 family phage terminase small subunit [Dehalococcoidia bacterium]